MPPVLKSALFIFGLPIFYLLGFWLFGRDPATIVIVSLLLGALATKSLAYRRAAIDSMKSGMKDGADNILVSLWVQGIALFLFFFWVLYLNSVPDAERLALRETAVSGTLEAFTLGAVIIAILVPANSAIPLARIATAQLVVYGVIGGMVAGIVGTLSFTKIFGVL